MRNPTFCARERNTPCGGSQNVAFRVRIKLGRPLFAGHHWIRTGQRRKVLCDAHPTGADCLAILAGADRVAQSAFNLTYGRRVQMLKHVLAGTIVALAFAATASAADAPAVPDELSQYDFMVGTWHCTGTAFASPMMAEHATTATVHVIKGVGGRWVHASYDENRTKANPKTYHADVSFGYDAHKKMFVERCVD